jgi:hypothetical protein
MAVNSKPPPVRPSEQRHSLLVRSRGRKINEQIDEAMCVSHSLLAVATGQVLRTFRGAVFPIATCFNHNPTNRKTHADRARALALNFRVAERR